MIKLNKLSIKRKIQISVTIPTVAYLLVAAWLLTDLWHKVDMANQLHQQINFFTTTSALKSGIEKERDFATSYLGGGNEILDYELQAKELDQRLLAYKKTLADANISKDLSEHFVKSLTGIAAIRQSIAAIESGEDEEDIDAESIILEYDQIITPLMIIEKNIAQSVELKGIGKFLSSTILLEQAKSNLGKNQGIITGILAEDEPIENALLNILISFHANVEQSLTSSALIVTKQSYQAIKQFRMKLHWEVISDTLNTLIENSKIGEYGFSSRQYLQNSQLAYADINATIRQELSTHLQTTSDLKAYNQRLIAISISLVVIIALVILFLSNKISKMIVRPVESMANIMGEIEKSGDFSQRVKVVSEDEVGRAGSTLNQLLESLQKAISSTNQVVSAVANGDFTQRIEENFNGDLNTLKDGVNASASSIEIALTEVGDVMEAVKEGDFSRRIQANLHGQLNTLKDNINASVGAMGGAITDINASMQAMSTGDFSLRIQTDLQGELLTLKQNLNNSMDGLEGAIKEINNVTRAQQDGDLSMRVAGNYSGELSSLKTAINASADSMSGAISEVNNVMNALKNGDFSKRIQINLSGDLDTLKTNLNDSIDDLERAINEIVYVSSEQQKGDLTARVSGDYAGKLGVLKASMNDSATNLNNAISKISELASTVTSTSAELSVGNNEMSSRAEQQAASLEETASTIDELTSTVAQTADSTQQALQLSTAAKDSATSGGEIIGDAISAMSEINNSSNKISNIITVIEEITFQTNLLALNAAVEAARAGEQGRGFAVVASEVRNLAQKSAEAAREISVLIKDSVAKVATGTKLVNLSGDELKQIVDNILKVNTIIVEISSASNEQKQSFSEVNIAVAQLDDITQHNAATAEEASAASDNLANQAQQMQEMVNFFNVTDNEEDEYSQMYTVN
ncbi:HAMP domain-containing protein [Beggiatoa alba]|nr:HAMP domain-containing protein [Beggiatoa alba]